MRGGDDSDIPNVSGMGITVGFRGGGKTGWFGEAGVGAFAGASHYRGDPVTFGVAPDVNVAVGYSF